LCKSVPALVYQQRNFRFNEEFWQRGVAAVGKEKDEREREREREREFF
jgi:hypothetical protein